MRYYRPTWAEVDLDNLDYNFHQIKKAVPEDTKIMACIKADAYGHGLIPVANKLVSCGMDYLSVASIDEAINLRNAGINSPILILGTILKKDIAPLFEYQITQTVCSDELAAALNEMARQKKDKVKIHIKVDTGMGRLGVLHEGALKFIEKIHRLKYLDIEGIFTHFPCADTKKDFTFRQLELFQHLVSQLRNRGIEFSFVHAANSLGIVGYKESHFNMVRPGLILYGLHPQAGLKIDLKPALSLKTRIVYLKRVPKGWGISYGHTYITRKDTNIATLPIGYGDGYPRNLSNLAPVLIQGKFFKVNGTICMDQLMVDIGDLPVEVGEEVVLIGEQKKRRITVEELAGLSNTIPYEIVCGLGSRVPREYIGLGKLVNKI